MCVNQCVRVHACVSVRSSDPLCVCMCVCVCVCVCVCHLLPDSGVRVVDHLQHAQPELAHVRLHSARAHLPQRALPNLTNVRQTLVAFNGTQDAETNFVGGGSPDPEGPWGSADP